VPPNVLQWHGRRADARKKFFLSQRVGAAPLTVYQLRHCRLRPYCVRVLFRTCPGIRFGPWSSRFKIIGYSVLRGASECAKRTGEKLLISGSGVRVSGGPPDFLKLSVHLALDAEAVASPITHPSPILVDWFCLQGPFKCLLSVGECLRFSSVVALTGRHISQKSPGAAFARRTQRCAIVL
jgi:hypothetical protein